VGRNAHTGAALADESVQVSGGRLVIESDRAVSIDKDVEAVEIVVVVPRPEDRLVSQRRELEPKLERRIDGLVEEELGGEEDAVVRAVELEASPVYGP
jgi:hypothetical protein